MALHFIFLILKSKKQNKAINLQLILWKKISKRLTESLSNTGIRTVMTSLPVF